MSKSIAAPRNTSAPEITHPAWCAPDRCDEDRTADGVLHDVIHIGKTTTWAGPESLAAELYLASADNFDGEFPDRAPEAFVQLHGAGSMAPSALFDLGALLIRRALDYGYTPASEVL